MKKRWNLRGLTSLLTLAGFLIMFLVAARELTMLWSWAAPTPNGSHPSAQQPRS